MYDFIIFMNNGNDIIITAKRFEWDNEDKTLCFFDEEDGYVAIFKQKVLYGVGLAKGTERLISLITKKEEYTNE